MYNKTHQASFWNYRSIALKVTRMSSNRINATRSLIMFAFLLFLIELSPFVTEVSAAHKCGR